MTQDEIRQRTGELYRAMSVEERIRQTDMFFGCELLDTRRPEPDCATVAPHGAKVDPSSFAARIGDNGAGFIHDLYPDPALYNELQAEIIRRSRLGIPAIFIEEALRGLCKPGCTVYPSQIALAATFDPSLAWRTGRAIATEARAAGIHGVLGPTMDLSRDPRWGRVEESYGEDVRLSADMAAAMVRGLQGDGIHCGDAVMAEPKHFAAHGMPEGGLNCAPAQIGERDLRQNALPVFESAIRDAGACNAMCAYHSLDGIPCVAHKGLLTGVLRDEWQMRGVVISDLGAIWRQLTVHRTAGTDAHAVANAWNAGCDVQFYDFPHDRFLEAMARALAEGLLEEAALERSVRRVLRLKLELGLFEKPFVDVTRFDEVNRCADHVAVSEAVGAASVTLLTNNGILPIEIGRCNTIAIVGPCADQPYFGGYVPHLEGFHVVTPLEGIRSRTDAHVCHSRGVRAEANRFEPFPANWLTAEDGTEGLTGRYFATPSFAGEPVLVRTDRSLDFNWAMAKPSDRLPASGYSVRWEGRIHTDADFTGRIGFSGTDAFTLHLDGTPRLVAPEGNPDPEVRSLPVHWTKGTGHALRIEYVKTGAGHDIRFGCRPDDTQEWTDGLDVAARADLVVAVMGDSKHTCSEGHDRSALTLPGRQRAFLQAIHALGKPIVLVLQTGRPVQLDWESEHVDAIVNLFSPGENGGNVLADMLFGVTNPAGRLPVSFPRSVGHLPCHYNRLPGSSHQYADGPDDALFAFGHGLSYTAFTYGNLQLHQEEDSFFATFTITNTGTRDGEEVAQLYAADRVSSVVLPEKELKAFRRLFIPTGCTETVLLRVPYSQLALVDAKRRLVAEKGEFRIEVGASSRDIRLTGTFTLERDIVYQAEVPRLS